MIGIGVIGYGYWGPNLVRNFSEAIGSRVAAVSDLRSERLAQVQARYPGVKTTVDHHELFADTDVDAVVIATPVASHFDLVMQALHSGKHVLVEHWSDLLRRKSCQAAAYLRDLKFFLRMVFGEGQERLNVLLNIFQRKGTDGYIFGRDSIGRPSNAYSVAVYRAVLQQRHAGRARAMASRKVAAKDENHLASLM